MKSIVNSIIFLTIFSFNLLSQNLPNYHPPLDIPLVLSANFGELRTNHFHMGVDFKTNGKTGYNMYAIDNGYVKRAVVSPYGYGRVIHIAHPNGVTSVYAHCQSFSKRIDSIIDLKRIELRNNEVDLELEPSEIKVNRGEIIAISGNTGASTAPHLHFELRDTKTDAAINPLLYGFDISDHVQPEIKRLKIYALSKEAYRYNKTREYSVHRSEQTFSCKKEIRLPSDFCSNSGGIGFAFDVIDKLDSANNPCGLFKGEIFVNDKLHFASSIDTVPFESTRYINCYKDFEEFHQNKFNFHKYFRTAENDLPIYDVEKNGVLKVKPGDSLKIKYIAQDVKGNRSTLEFNIIIDQGPMNTKDAVMTSLDAIYPSKPLTLIKPGIRLTFEKGTVYEPLEIDRSIIDYRIGNPSIPVHLPYKLELKRSVENNEYLQIISHGRIRKIMFEERGPITSCEIKYFGDYNILKDSVPPRVVAQYSSSIVRRGTIRWSIHDSESGIESYWLTVGDDWVPLEYENKTSMVTAKNLEYLGEQEVTFEVRDHCGNAKTWRKIMDFR